MREEQEKIACYMQLIQVGNIFDPKSRCTMNELIGLLLSIDFTNNYLDQYVPKNI